MKVCAFVQTPYRELPADFERRYPSVVMAPWWELARPEKMGQYYRWTIDSLLHAARAGLDGVAITEHSQNVYDVMPNPNLVMASLATLTEGLPVALVVLGTTVGKSHQPLRIAEEYAMLDCLSDGRLVAGLPLGLSYDANINYGVTPLQTRERYMEAHRLIVKAWTAREVFPWNGKFWQFPAVNLWPRPVQQPHPPVWVPGVGTPGTMQWVLANDYCYCYLSWFGPRVAARSVIPRYWEIAAQMGKEANPYRLAYLQVVVVSDTDARAEEEYGPHVEYFFHKCLAGIPLAWLGLPGYIDYPGLEYLMRDPRDLGLFPQLREMRFKDFAEGQFVIAGSPATVRDQLLEVAREFRVGNLLAMLHIGSLPHELALKNIELFAREVLPHLRPLWDSEGWEHRWWPRSLLAGRSAPSPPG